MGRELVDEFGGLAWVGEQIAPRDVDIGVESESDRVTRLGAFERTLEGDDLFEPCEPARTGRQHRLAWRNRARDYRPRAAAEVAVRAIDPLDRKAEWPPGSRIRNVDGLQVLDQSRPAVPGHPSRFLGYIVAESRRE